MGWVHLTQNRTQLQALLMLMKFWVLQQVKNFLCTSATICFLSKAPLHEVSWLDGWLVD
jgi:hypothetical protein